MKDFGLESLAEPHCWMPYVKVGFSIVLYIVEFFGAEFKFNYP
jgi:hypothetical protein